MDKNRVSTERETDQTLRRQAGNTIYMPVTRYLVEGSPSATAIDQHMINLGWPYDVARGMRSAFKIWKLDSMGWVRMGESDERPSGVFSFGRAYHSIDGFLGATHLRLLGATVQLPVFPLLSEFQVVLPKQDKQLLTSFDGFGDQGSIGSVKPNELMASFNFRYGKWETAIQGSGFNFGVGWHTHPGHAGIFVHGSREWQFDSRAVWYYPKPGCIPRLAKHVRIEHELEDDWSERVSLLYYIDGGPVVERARHWSVTAGQFLAYQLRHRLSPGVTALAEIRYALTDDGKISTRQEEKTPLRIVCDSVWSDHHGSPSSRLLDPSDTMPRLCDAVSKLYAHSSYPTWLKLEQIVGEGILTNPPATLLELFAAPY